MITSSAGNNLLHMTAPNWASDARSSRTGLTGLGKDFGSPASARRCCRILSSHDFKASDTPPYAAIDSSSALL